MDSISAIDWLFKAIILGVLGLMYWQFRQSFTRLERGQETIHARIDKLDDEHDDCKTDTVQRLTRLETRVDGLEKR